MVGALKGAGQTWASPSRHPSGCSARIHGKWVPGSQGEGDSEAPRALGQNRTNATLTPVKGAGLAPVLPTEAAGGPYRGSVINNHSLQAPRYAESHEDVEYIASYGVRDCHVAQAWRGQ